MEFTLTPVSKEYYNNEVRISHRKRKINILKVDKLEIEYYKRMGIDINPFNTDRWVIERNRQKWVVSEMLIII